MLEHRFAQLVAACTFLLLVVGGTVNATGSSLACPEPTLLCHGEIFPTMTGGVLFEHGHRLVAMSVGLLQIVLTVLLVRRRKELRGLAWLTLAMVILQGALGAVTVKYKLPWFVSTGHLLLGMSYFATLLYIAWRTRPRPEASPPSIDLGSARSWITIATGVVIIQLLLGALVRHSEAALACLGMPDCTAGEWFPAALTQRLHMIHRAWGVIVGVITTIAAVAVYRRAAGWRGLRAMMIVAPLVVATQVALGIYVVLTLRATPVAVAHFAGAATLWGLWISAWFMTRPAARQARAAFAPVRGVHAVP